MEFSTSEDCKHKHLCTTFWQMYYMLTVIFLNIDNKIIMTCPLYAPVLFIDGLAGSGATCLLKRMPCRLSIYLVEQKLCWGVGWIRARLVFAILRESVLCIHGCRTKWRSALRMVLHWFVSITLRPVIFVLCFFVVSFGFCVCCVCVCVCVCVHVREYT